MQRSAKILLALLVTLVSPRLAEAQFEPLLGGITDVGVGTSCLLKGSSQTRDACGGRSAFSVELRAWAGDARAQAH
jgi:hypothetical protein